jgi:ubiquinone/menaquinone biosynthesis C-methylase UbiE
MRESSGLAGAFTAPDAKRRYVRRLFATIADRYDLITVLLSFGRDRHWKQRLIDLARAGPGSRVLDLACGTGDLAFEAACRGATVIGLDLTPRMIELAKSKADLHRTGTGLDLWKTHGSADEFPTDRDASPSLCKSAAFLVGDMAALPFAAERFNVVTTGYGLRNVPDLAVALAEIFRVLEPGGTVCSLDFDRPEQPWIRAIYLAYLTAVGSVLGWILHRDPDTYRYIPESIRRYPGARGVADLMRSHGFTDVRAMSVCGGFMGIHVARKG